MFKIVIAACMMLAAGVIAVRYVDQTGRGPAAMTVGSAPVISPVATNSRSVTVARGPGGHFTVDARVDNRRVEFIVDTGATHIALRQSDAARLGIHPRASDFTAKVNTANGVARAAVVNLRVVEVGGIVVRDLKALVHHDEALGVNLLGMSFLGRVRWTYERGRLVLEQ
jgi:aspartyl protease family protein